MRCTISTGKFGPSRKGAFYELPIPPGGRSEFVTNRGSNFPDYCFRYPPEKGIETGIVGPDGLLGGDTAINGLAFGQSKWTALL